MCIIAAALGYGRARASVRGCFPMSLLQVRYEDEDEDEGPQPDATLEQGAPLPVRLVGTFPPELASVPLEDIDPYYHNQKVSGAHGVITLSRSCTARPEDRRRAENGYACTDPASPPPSVPSLMRRRRRGDISFGPISRKHDLFRPNPVICSDRSFFFTCRL